jgi:hypothetical protein
LFSVEELFTVRSTLYEESFFYKELSIDLESGSIPDFLTGEA